MSDKRADTPAVSCLCPHCGRRIDLSTTPIRTIISKLPKMRRPLNLSQDMKDRICDHSDDKEKP